MKNSAYGVYISLERIAVTEQVIVNLTIIATHHE
jgi:hypothetical protein